MVQRHETNSPPTTCDESLRPTSHREKLLLGPSSGRNPCAVVSKGALIAAGLLPATIGGKTSGSTKRAAKGAGSKRHAAASPASRSTSTTPMLPERAPPTANG